MRNSVLFITRSAVACIAISACEALANPVTVSIGAQDYSVTYQNFSYSSSPSRFSTQEMPWWGNIPLVTEFVTQVGNRFGNVQLGYGPFFAFSADSSDVNFGLGAAWYDNGVSGGFGPLGAVYAYAIAFPIAPPLTFNPASTQPYADIQSISLDAIKNQRELVLNQAGNCDQRGWVVYDSDKSKDAKKPKKNQSLCVFAEGGYAQGDINGFSSIGGYSTNNASSAYGIEWKPSKQWSVGASYGYGTANLTNFNFQNTTAYITSNINSANLYGVYRPDKNWNVAALVGYSSFNYTGNRAYLGNTANSTFSSNGYTGALQATYDIILSTNYNNKKNPLNPVRVKPLLGIAWGGNQQAGFSETGAGTLLNVQGQTANSLMGTVGASIEAPIPLNTSKTMALTPRFGIAYQYDFLANQDGNKSITSNLQNNPATSYSVVGQNRGANSVYLDLGTDLQINPLMVVYATVNYQAFTNGNQIGYQGGLRVKF